MKHPALAALVTAALAACAGTAPIVVPSRFDDRGIARRAAFATLCPLRLSDVSDTRADPATLGTVGRRPVQAEDFAAWLRGGMDRRLAIARHGDAPPLSLEVQVLKAYAQSVAMSKSVDIVVRVRFLGDGQVRGEQVYRGAATALNWTGADDEIRGAFAQALAGVVDQVTADSLSYCSTATAPAV